MMATRAYVALGSNLGNRRENILAAKAAIAALAVRDVTLSSLYHTVPEGMTGAPEFVNAVAGFDTRLSARDLLHALQVIEVDMGRPVAHGVNQSRVIDLDLIAFGADRIHEPDLIVPHPRAHLRDFVLVPLAEIAPGLRLAGHSRTVGEIANGFAGARRIISISHANRHE